MNLPYWFGLQHSPVAYWESVYGWWISWDPTWFDSTLILDWKFGCAWNFRLQIIFLQDFESITPLPSSFQSCWEVRKHSDSSSFACELFFPNPLEASRILSLPECLKVFKLWTLSKLILSSHPLGPSIWKTMAFSYGKSFWIISLMISSLPFSILLKRRYKTIHVCKWDLIV